jgi:hypothetical protein
MTTLRDRSVKIGAKIVRHGRSVIFQMAEVAVPRALFQEILSAIVALRPSPPGPMFENQRPDAPVRLWRETRAQDPGCGSEDPPFAPPLHRSREVAGP